MYYGVVDGGACECGKPTTEDHRPGKHPRMTGWQTYNATKDHDLLIEWFVRFPKSAFAVVTGYDTVVLDLDIHGEKNGVEALAKIEAEAGETLPPTVTVLSGSGSGSNHRYFKVPADLERLQRPKGSTGIDFLRSRQGAILPGTLHQSGNYYRYAPGLSPDEIEIAEIPDWFIERMATHGAVSGKRDTASTSNFEGGDIDELIAALLECGPPVGSMPPGRKRPDDVVKRKMDKVPFRRYPDDRSHSDSHWAWTLARYCSHHWDQYLRLWRESSIRTLPDTKCGYANYERDILDKAFTAQKQQWANLKKRPLDQSANPTLAKHIRGLKTSVSEKPRSPITEAVIGINIDYPHLKDRQIADVLNDRGTFTKLITRNYVKEIRRRYSHIWKKPE